MHPSSFTPFFLPRRENVPALVYLGFDQVFLSAPKNQVCIQNYHLFPFYPQMVAREEEGAWGEKGTSTFSFEIPIFALVVKIHHPASKPQPGHQGSPSGEDLRKSGSDSSKGRVLGIRARSTLISLPPTMHGLCLQIYLISSMAPRVIFFFNFLCYKIKYNTKGPAKLYSVPQVEGSCQQDYTRRQRGAGICRAGVLVCGFLNHPARCSRM